MRVVTAEQMRAADAAAVARIGDVALMRAAGAAIAGVIARIVPRARTIVAFAGTGNNGGDAFAAFADLPQTVRRIVYVDEPSRRSAGRADAERRAGERGVVTRPFPHTAAAVGAALAGADLVLDALLGVGARGEPAERFHAVIDALARDPTRVLAIDVPSGVDATTGAVARSCVRANATVTLGAPKLGLFLDPARAYAGRIYARAIGLTGDVERADGDAYRTMTDDEFVALVPTRSPGGDKRLSGAPLVVAGSPQFPGAAILCARAAARAGAGYVTVATPHAVAGSLRAHLVEEVVVDFDDTNVAETIETLLDLTKRSNAVAIGPGLGLSDATGEIVRGFLARLERPFVADASALYHLGKNLELVRGKACVLTPHAGEFARLSGEGTVEPGMRIARLRSFVRRTGIATLLKGETTLIDDGTTMHLNRTGTSALATAGTGDVLTGTIATLMARGLAPIDAARAGAYWHGLAGRAAARRRAVGVVASDVIEALSDAHPRVRAAPALRSECSFEFTVRES